LAAARGGLDRKKCVWSIGTRKKGGDLGDVKNCDWWGTKKGGLEHGRQKKLQ